MCSILNELLRILKIIKSTVLLELTCSVINKNLMKQLLPYYLELTENLKGK